MTPGGTPKQAPERSIVGTPLEGPARRLVSDWQPAPRADPRVAAGEPTGPTSFRLRGSEDRRQ
jgi:hypothetical protein